MLLHIEQVLNADELQQARALTGPSAPWVDGRRSAGPQAVHAKNNEQLAQDSDASRTLQALVLAALNRNALFFSAALCPTRRRPVTWTWPTAGIERASPLTTWTW